MKKPNLIDLIINKRTLIEKVFVVCVIISMVCVPFVKVNYDISKYLPDWAPSKQGLDLMEEEFGYPGTARVMVGDVSIYEAKLIKDRIENVDGVDMVLWADSTNDIYQASQFLNYKDMRDYYKDGFSVMDVTFDESDSSTKTHQAIDKIVQITEEKGYLSGSAVQNKSLSETMVKEMAMAMVMGVIVIALILCLTTNSWFEPFLFLLVMGIAIVINMGTNIFLGTISFLTNNVAAVLQLAIAMDYSIFLLHSFTREREAEIEPKQAIANAIRSSVSSILSSGATTIVGFIVLTLMQFSIGFDMGIVLAKGIVISLLTVLLLMPALILRWSPKVEKTAHRPFVPSMEPLARGIYKCRKVIFAVVLILVIPAFVAQNMNAFLFGNDALGSSPGTKVYQDEKAINAHFGRSNMMLALVPNTSMVTEKELTDELAALSYTKSVTSLAGSLPAGVPEGFLPQSLTGQLHTEHYSRILIFVKTATESELSFACSDEIQDILAKYYPEDAHLVGMTPSTQDIRSIITKDYNSVNLLSLLGVAIVILLTFKSGIIPLIVMIPIEVAIFFNMAIPYLVGDSMIFMGYIIVSCLQLGATIDYSILLTNNYLNFRTSMEKKEAAIQAISKSALSVLTSGTILTTVGYGLYFTSTVAAIGDMGRLIGRGALLSMMLVLCMLPILLMMSDRLIFNQRKRLGKMAKLRNAKQKKVKVTKAALQKDRRQSKKRRNRRRRRVAWKIIRAGKREMKRKQKLEKEQKKAAQNQTAPVKEKKRRHKKIKWNLELRPMRRKQKTKTEQGNEPDQKNKEEQK